MNGINEKLRTDFVGTLDHQLTPFSLPPPAKPNYDYFPQTRQLIRAHYDLARGVDRELDENKQLTEAVRKVAKLIYRIRPALSLIPKAGPPLAAAISILEGAEAEKLAEPAVQALQHLDALKKSGGPFFYPLLKRRKDQLRHDPYNAFADAYVGDLTAMLYGYSNKDRHRFTHSKLRELNRLILIVDDFETTSRLLGEFLVTSVLRRLAEAPFPVLVIFAGRDDLAVVHPSFLQHHANALTHRMRLTPFDRDEAIRYLQEAGYDLEKAIDLYNKSRGFPFVLSLFAEHCSKQEQQSAVFYQQFFDRTTHWMSEQEKSWLLQLCFLDTINEATISAMLPECDEILVMDWFRREASARDTGDASYVVEPFIREMILEYHRKLVGSAKCQDLMARARSAMERA